MAEKILFFFGALGVFNALLLAIYLLIVKPNRRLDDYFLGILLFYLVIRVGVSCFHFFGQAPHELIKLGLMANLFIGPVVLLLMRALINPDKVIINRSLWQFGLLSFGLVLSWVLFDLPTWNWKIRYIIHFVLTVYLIQVAFIWRREFGYFFSSKGLTFNVRKAIIIYLAIVLICFGFAVSLFSSYIVGPLSFSIIFYLAMGYLLSNSPKELDTPKKKRYFSRKQVAPQEFNDINQKLTQLMEIDNIYRDPDLKLEALATQLAISRHLLSKILNDNLDVNFHQYINNYRIREACRILRENKHYSIEAIAYEVGFHSRSSFFTAFKKLKGTTPSKYRQEG
ncbi:AraC family transcriptional regulator [Tunicatimonas pelagia]|uniref:AraC family transcriptional regulator n=1 Tax=Tunicatimonas pelagia TaxID=931531 RepID=UPI0026654DA3|nr:helix-turn-helix domain-containing protein [Tunicatimonas pelagia]WKN40557.1 helix-turn-helix domain-containing protein [Tunicatimonas pelagia]